MQRAGGEKRKREKGVAVFTLKEAGAANSRLWARPRGSSSEARTESYIRVMAEENMKEEKSITDVTKKDYLLRLKLFWGFVGRLEVACIIGEDLEKCLADFSDHLYLKGEGYNN